MGGSQPACVQLNRLRPPDLIDTLSLSRFPFIHYPPGTFTSDISILIRHTILHSTFWASSPRPLTSRSDFALGTSQGTILVAEDQASWSFERRMGFLDGGHDQRAKEVMAVDWLDGNVVLNGCRDGSVRFWDVRSRSVAGTSVPIVHGSAVNHVRRLGGNNVVVAGIEDRMANYDLRFLRKEGGGRKGETRPCVVFRGYRNRELGALKVGFDVLGDRLVAAGMDDEGVVVFEGGTGGVVRGLGGGGGLAGCVRFVEGEGREGRRLWVGGGRGIVEWAW